MLTGLIEPWLCAGRISYPETRAGQTQRIQERPETIYVPWVDNLQQVGSRTEELTPHQTRPSIEREKCISTCPVHRTRLLSVK